MCQCPLGLIPHFYDTLGGRGFVYEESVNALSGLYLISTSTNTAIPTGIAETCQCPLGLIPHFYIERAIRTVIQNTWVCQCPLGLIPHFYGTPSKT